MNERFKDISGQRYGKLVAVKRVGTKTLSGRTYSVWHCKCDCGREIETTLSNLTGGVKSCGHCTKGIKSITHGKRKERLYRVWLSMRERCRNPRSKSYCNYGGRGIAVCDEWENYLSFRTWAYANGYNESANFGECTIDRIDVNGNYEPKNCRIADLEVQANNTRRNIRIEMDGTVKTLKQWCDQFNCDYATARYRRSKGKCVKDWFDANLPYEDVKIV